MIRNSEAPVFAPVVVDDPLLPSRSMEMPEALAWPVPVFAVLVPMLLFSMTP